jgi:hypothetical protein
MSLLIVQVKTVKTSPFELGWWGWSQPFSSGPGIFLYKMLGLGLQGGSAWKLCLKSGEKTLSQKIQLWDCATSCQVKWAYKMTSGSAGTPCLIANSEPIKRSQNTRWG